MSTADPRRATCCGFYGVPRACGASGAPAPPFQRFGGQPAQKQCPVPRLLLPKRSPACQLRLVHALKFLAALGYFLVTLTLSLYLTDELGRCLIHCLRLAGADRREERMST